MLIKENHQGVLHLRLKRRRTIGAAPMVKGRSVNRVAFRSDQGFDTFALSKRDLTTARSTTATTAEMTSMLCYAGSSLKISPLGLTRMLIHVTDNIKSSNSCPRTNSGFSPRIFSAHTNSLEGAVTSYPQPAHFLPFFRIRVRTTPCSFSFLISSTLPSSTASRRSSCFRLRSS